MTLLDVAQTAVTWLAYAAATLLVLYVFLVAAGAMLARWRPWL